MVSNTEALKAGHALYSTRAVRRLVGIDSNYILIKFIHIDTESKMLKLSWFSI